MHVRVYLSRYRGYFECPDCTGSRLKETSLFWKWKSYTLPDLYRLPVDDLLLKISRVSLSGDPANDLPLENIKSRLGYLQQVGLGYLSLDRSARSLSGGETQRVNLTACLGSSLTDTLFALDEPTIGLHLTPKMKSSRSSSHRLPKDTCHRIGNDQSCCRHPVQSR